MKRLSISLVTACLFVIPTFGDLNGNSFIATAHALGNGNGGNSGGNNKGGGNAGGNGDSKSSSSQSKSSNGGGNAPQKATAKTTKADAKSKSKSSGSAAVRKSGKSENKIAINKPIKTGKVAKVAKVEKVKPASGLGALNALNASPKAFAKASPKSRLGKIKAYYTASLEAEKASAAIVSAQQILDEKNALLLAAKAEYETLASNAALATDARLKADVELQAATTALDALVDVASDDPAFIAATERLAKATTDLADASELELKEKALLAGASTADEMQAVADAEVTLNDAKTASTKETAEAEALLQIAANKTLDAETRAKFDAMLKAKLAASLY